MTENRPRSRTSLPHRFFNSCVVLICCAGALLGGCSIRRRPSIPWATAIQVRPVIQPQTATEIPEDPIPELRLEFPALPTRVTTHNGPVRPRMQPVQKSSGVVRRACYFTLACSFLTVFHVYSRYRQRPCGPGHACDWMR